MAFAILLNFLIIKPIVSVASGINDLINFQGKIVTIAGINIPNGTYNVEFKVYAGGTSTGGGTLDWTEDYLVGGSGGGIIFSSGTFDVQLGSVCPFSGGSCETYTNSAVDWNSNPLYMSIQVGNTSTCTVSSNFLTNCGGDGEMSPYILLTSTPYAFNSNELNGLTSASFGQLSSGQTWDGSNIFQPASNITGLVVRQTSSASPTADIFDVKTVGSSNILQVTGSGANTADVNINAVGLSNNITINASGSGTATFDNTGTASNIQIGNTTGSVAQTINIGNNLTSGSISTISIGSTTAGSVVNLTGNQNIVGDKTICTSGEFCVAQNVVNPSGSGTSISSNKISELTGTSSGTPILIAQGYSISDISVGGIGDLLQGININSTSTSNTSTIVTGIVVDNPTVNPGYLLQLEGYSGTSSNLFTVSNSGAVVLAPSNGASNALSVNSVSAPTVDTVAISTQSVTTNGVNAVSINYSGGSAAVEGSGFRIDYAPGGTSGGTWNGMRIVANSAGAATGVAANGIQLDGPTSSGGGVNTAINIGTGWDIGLDIGSGGMQLDDMTGDPNPPATQSLLVYAENVDGRSMLKEEGPSGVAYVIQPSLFQQNVVLVTGGNGTSANTYTTVGSNVTASGTLSSTAGSSSEALGNTSRIATSTTAGTVSGFYTKNAYYLGSLTNGANGFFYFTRMNLNGQNLTNYESPSTGSRIFLGMCSATYTTGCGGSDTPTTYNVAGFQLSGSRSDTTFHFITCNGSACNVIDTGVTVVNNNTYDFYAYTPPLGTTVYWRIDDQTTGTNPVTGSTITDLPTGSAALYAGNIIDNLSAAARYLYFQRMYFETDR